MDYELNSNDRLQLQKMIKANDVIDQTDTIRQTRHSKKIRDEVKILEKLITDNIKLYENNIQEFDALAVNKCNFIFHNYTDIYNKIIKNEIDLKILDKFLDALEMIEEGKTDQHEASVNVGKYLKELYIDSALKKTEKLDNENKNSKEENINNNFINISWNEYKKNKNKK
tara:strand:- start:5 stop:514 length:510 start_codon:yes stop_codon:yes gene_type:complete